MRKTWLTLLKPTGTLWEIGTLDKFIPAWISNYTWHKVGDETNYPFPYFYSCAIEIWAWIKYFTQKTLLGMWSFIHGRVKDHPCYWIGHMVHKLIVHVRNCIHKVLNHCNLVMSYHDDDLGLQWFKFNIEYETSLNSLRTLSRDSRILFKGIQKIPQDLISFLSPLPSFFSFSLHFPAFFTPLFHLTWQQGDLSKSSYGAVWSSASWRKFCPFPLPLLARLPHDPVVPYPCLSHHRCWWFLNFPQFFFTPVPSSTFGWMSCLF